MVTTVKFSEFAQAVPSNPTNMLVGVSSDFGGANIQMPFPFSWNNSTRPIIPVAGTFGYNTSLGQMEYWNGLMWLQLASGGSGTVNIGAQNDVAFYPASGTAINGISTANNAGLFTDGSGVPSMVAATGTGSPVRNTSPTLISPTLDIASATSINFTSTDGIIGTTMNDNASVGSVGELISSIIPFSSSILLTSGVATEVTHVNLHRGDWDIWGNVSFSVNVSASNFQAWINNTVSPPDTSLIVSLNIANMASCGFVVPSQRISLSTSTPIYLSCISLFSGNVSVCGGIYARVRR